MCARCVICVSMLCCHRSKWYCLWYSFINVTNHTFGGCVRYTNTKIRSSDLWLFLVSAVLLVGVAVVGYASSTTIQYDRKHRPRCSCWLRRSEADSHIHTHPIVCVYYVSLFISCTRKSYAYAQLHEKSTHTDHASTIYFVARFKLCVSYFVYTVQ